MSYRIVQLSFKCRFRLQKTAQGPESTQTSGSVIKRNRWFGGSHIGDQKKPRVLGDRNPHSHKNFPSIPPVPAPSAPQSLQTACGVRPKPGAVVLFDFGSGREAGGEQNQKEGQALQVLSALRKRKLAGSAEKRRLAVSWRWLSNIW